VQVSSSCANERVCALYQEDVRKARWWIAEMSDKLQFVDVRYHSARAARDKLEEPLVKLVKSFCI